jgi:Ca2+/H+ antiporter
MSDQADEPIETWCLVAVVVAGVISTTILHKGTQVWKNFLLIFLIFIIIMFLFYTF